MGIANPVGAFALAAVAVLIFLTLYERRRRIRRVSSLVLWRQLRAAPVERRRFRVDLAFLLQLAMLLALIGGYVRPYLAGPVAPTSGTALVAVLDCSASMQTREDGGSRFALARARLATVIDALPAGSPVMLVTAAERPHVVLRWTGDPSRVAAALEAVAATDAPTRLAPAVELAIGAAARRPGASIVVVTDLPPAPVLRRGPVRWIQVGRSDDNVGVTALRVDAPPFGELRDVRVVASVRNFGAREHATTLDASVDGAPWARRVVRLPSRATAQVLFDRPAASGVVRVRLVDGDALAADDEAVAWLPAPAPLRVLLVTESDPMAAAFSALIARLPDAGLEVVNAAGWRERGGSGTAGQVVVFDRLGLDATGPAVWVAPPPGHPVCRAVRRIDGAAVIDWDDAHPIAGGLDGLEALEVTAGTQLETPSWARPIVQASSRTAAFPLLLAGERGGRRQACLAAALPVPLTSSDALPLLLLTVATVRWVATDPSEVPVTVQTGVPAAAAGMPPARTDAVRVAGATLLARRVGVHRLPRGPGADGLVLANLFDATESDVGRDGGGDWPALEPPSPVIATAGAHVELGWWLYALGALLLAAEWVVGARR